jgi:putative protein-disulfide isomerase
MEPKRVESKEMTGDALDGSPDLHVTYFTDPLCCWSWGFQPHLEALQTLYDKRMSVQYVMGGMLPSWEHFRDEVHAVSRPAQMGPVWMHAAQLTGRPINYHLWIKDPPASSYPACIAVKCAALQSAELGVTYFKHLQEATMTQAQNISSWPVLQAVAKEVAKNDDSFDVARFLADYQQQKGVDAFRADLALAARYQVTRFPTIVIESPGKKGIVISGYRTAEALNETITRAFGRGVDE